MTRKETTLPKFPYVNRDDLTNANRHIYDEIAGSRGSVGHVFQALLTSPEVAEVVSAVGEYIRYRSPIDPMIREIAILATAKENDNDYEWSSHVTIARAAGVREEVIDAIRSGKAPMGLPAKEGVFVQAAKELFRNGTLNVQTFQAVEHLLGPLQTVDLIVLVGYYSLLSRVITTLDVELDEGVQSNLRE